VDNTENKSIIEVNLAGCNHQFVFDHPPGTFALTPASKTLIKAIIKNNNLLHGLGIDWGSGVGCLAIVAAKIAKVDKVYGLEISKGDVNVACENAKANNVFDKVSFLHSDSYCPYSEQDQTTISFLIKKVDFILANPPSSEGDDGFGFRREVLRGGKTFLKANGRVFLNISFQYGQLRIENLAKQVDGYLYKGLLYGTDWVPFDLNRADLLHCLGLYSEEEKNGGLEYTFKSPDANLDQYFNARTAYQYFKETEKSPLTRWQTHLFEIKD
jgi:hypothetical protein